MAKEDPRLRRLRVGDAERHGAVDALGEHFVAGRLDQEEHHQRCTQAMQARTAADLMQLFADLPLPHPDVVQLPTAPPQGGVQRAAQRGTPGRAGASPARSYPTMLVAVVAIIAIAALVRAPLLLILLVGLAIYLVLSGGRGRR